MGSQTVSPVFPLPDVSTIIPVAHNDDYFYFSHVYPRDVIRSISSFSSNAMGDDKLTLRYFKICLPVILPFLIDLLNFSLTHSVFPSQWKRSLIFPVKKIRNPSLPNHFRPIPLCVPYLRYLRE